MNDAFKLQTYSSVTSELQLYLSCIITCTCISAKANRLSCPAVPLINHLCIDSVNQQKKYINKMY